MLGHRAAGSAQPGGPGDPTNEGLSKQLCSRLEWERVGVLPSCHWAEGLEMETAEGVGFRAAPLASSPVLPIPRPGSPSLHLPPCQDTLRGWLAGLCLE